MVLHALVAGLMAIGQDELQITRSAPHGGCRNVEMVVEIGLGKSGTTSVQEWFGRLGYPSKHPCDLVANMFTQASKAGRPLMGEVLERCTPPHFISDFGAVLHPKDHFVYQVSHIHEIYTAMRAKYPKQGQLLVVHTSRNKTTWFNSARKWNHLVDRLANRDLPGLPAGVGHKRADMEAWYAGVNAFLSFYFAHRPEYVPVTLTDPESVRRLQDRCGTTLPMEHTMPGSTKALRAKAGAGQLGASPASRMPFKMNMTRGLMVRPHARDQRTGKRKVAAARTQQAAT